MQSDTRYPFTYACDFIRGLAGYNESGTKLSRSDASQILAGMVLALGDSQLAEKLADYYKANEDEIAKQATRAALAARGITV